MNKRYLALFMGVTAASFVAAHVRLIYSGNGNVLYWNNPENISVVIKGAGSADISNDGHFPALRNAISAWNEAGGTTAKLVEDKRSSEQASSNWQSNSRHMILFDESNSSGYFPGVSGIVAVTPVTFYTSGSIIDADVLFNGKDHLFTTEGVLGRFDVQDVATHELGHLLGLDHSGCAGSTMYPYVDPSVILHRSLSLDDIHGLQHMYPAGSFARITGSLTRASNGSPVRGAWVGARDENGRVVGAVLSRSSGGFTIPSLVPGTYSVYATPLDGPVRGSNFGPGRTIETNFEARVLGTVTVSSGSSASMGSFGLSSDVSVELGRVSDDYPLRTIHGQSNALIVRGSSLAPGSTLTCSDPAITLGSISWNNSFVSFTATPEQGAPPGHADLQVTTASGDTHILSAALEVTPPDPVVSRVSTIVGPSAGGVPLRVEGSNFRDGCRIVIGDQRYHAGTDATLMDSNTIALATKDTLPGIHDVVVIDPTGVEGRLRNGFQVIEHPKIFSIFPTGGDFTGGTTVMVNGDDFTPGTTVMIDGVVQSNLTIKSLKQIELVTDPGVVGGPYVLEVTGLSGNSASGAFVYAGRQDPVLASVSPKEGSRSGGEKITLTGSGFTTRTKVFFGSDPATGAGGVPAASIVLVNSNVIKVTTPASASGSLSVMTREADTGQASVLPGAYSFVSEGAAWGGCASISPATPPTWGRALGGAGWILVLASLLVWRARRAARVVVTYPACPARNG